MGKRFGSKQECFALSRMPSRSFPVSQYGQWPSGRGPGRRLALLVLPTFAVFSLVLGAATLFAQPFQDPETLAFQKASLEGWLVQASLADALKLEKLRWDTNPVPDAPEYPEVLRLELRFLSRDTVQKEADRHFQEFLIHYQTTFGESVPERVFYRLVHECQVGRQEAVVTIRVVQREYIVFLDPASADVKFLAKADRSIPMELPLELPRPDASGRLQAAVGASPSTDRRALTALIDKFLRDYFAEANRQAHRPDPKFTPDDVRNRDHDHVGFTVSGIKSQVLTDKNYWEEIGLSVDVVQAPSGLKLICHVDGYYASGVGSKLPEEDAYDDMRKNYQDRLRSFANGLLSHLQKRIETGVQ